MTSVAWGTSSFVGGYASRRTNPFLLSTIAHLAALAFLLLLAATVGGPIPSRHALMWSLLSGTAGGLALAAFYRSLASGPMGLAAPIVSVVSVCIPAAVTIVREGSPGAPALIGFMLAVLGISLIGWSGDKADTKRVGMAILVGCGFAAFSLSIKQAGAGSAIWIEVNSRAAALVITAAVTFFGGQLRAIQRPAVPWAAAAGLLDVTGSLAFIRASQLGRLDIAVVLSSLYSAVTVILAVVLLKERLTIGRAIGVGVVLSAIPLILRSR